MVGLLLVIGAYLRIATLIQYISRSVITGYITAAAALIIANQIKKALGFEFTADEPATTFFEVANQTLRGLGSTHLPTLGLGIVTAAIYLLLKRYAAPAQRSPDTNAFFVNRLLAQKISPDLRSPDAQPQCVEWGFSAPRANFDSINLLLTPAMAIALLCVLEGNSIGKSLAARDGTVWIAIRNAQFRDGQYRLRAPLRYGGLWFADAISIELEQRGQNARLVLSGLIVLAGVFALAPLIGYIPSFARCCRCRNRNFAAERPSAPNGNQNDQIR